MSCISEILKRKGDQEYLVANDSFAVENGGIYKGYEWLVTFVSLGFRCGYVAVPKGHYLHGFDLTGCSPHGEETDICFDVYGGITFSETGEHVISPVLGDFHCDDMWIGFDTGNLNDAKDIGLMEKLFPNEFKNHCEIEKKISSYREYKPRNFLKLRTKEYMEKECKSLIDQIIEREPNGS